MIALLSKLATPEEALRNTQHPLTFASCALINPGVHTGLIHATDADRKRKEPHERRQTMATRHRRRVNTKGRIAPSDQNPKITQHAGATHA